MITIKHVEASAVPIGPQGHQVHLDRSEKAEKGMRATCVCGTVAEPLSDAAEVLRFIQTHRGATDV